jgi:hypothetical protein
LRSSDRAPSERGAAEAGSKLQEVGAEEEREAQAWRNSGAVAEDAEALTWAA